MEKIKLPTMSEISENESNARISNAMADAGFNKKVLPYCVVPDIKSGYSMGETIVIKCNGSVLMTLDHTQQYSGKFKGRETYGHIVFDLAKKQVKEWSNLCEKLHKNEYYIELYSHRDREHGYMVAARDTYLYLSNKRTNGISVSEELLSIARDDMEKRENEYKESLAIYQNQIINDVIPIKDSISKLFSDSLSADSKYKKLDISR